MYKKKTEIHLNASYFIKKIIKKLNKYVSFNYLLSQKMKVFQDIFTNDEIMSDVFKFELAYDDVIMKVKSRLASKDNCANVDIG